jgi:hypothetical protein
MSRFAYLVAALAVVAAAVPAAQEADAHTVRSRLFGYLASYEPLLSTLVAEERLVQWPRVRTAMSRRNRMLARTLVSDVAFVALPGEVGWLGFATSGWSTASRSNGPASRWTRCSS